MSQPDASNHLFYLAARFVNQTNRHLFLTGKAGTGKTTFLRYIRENTNKRMAIIAPTGVAAINAGGVTMHSFFQLPFGAYIPSPLAGWNSNQQFNNQNTLLKNLKLSRDKKELLRELELLVIDEVSMLRADLLDEIDLILRHVRRKPEQSFGGVQLLYIGDLFQLPPVVSNEEWEVLKDHYRSPFFFDAQVLQQHPPVYLELKKIYRQHEADFIDILNNIRNNTTTDQDLDRLHQHYRPGYQQEPGENFIILTTHNAKADTINQQQLNKLDGTLYEFQGLITKDFNEKALPAERLLQLKEGAQIMFIKNDKGESRRYYNGKIAVISRIAGEKIYVNFPGESYEMELEKETWKNIRYQYNREEDNIEEEEMGSYTQFPIRLAWAITIHKSQGLTFEKAIIDAGASFAPGQVYVALSRLTSLEGLILFSRIQPHCIQTDARTKHFSNSEQSEDLLQHLLEEEQKLFVARSLVKSFDFTKMAETFREHYDDYHNRQLTDMNTAINWAQTTVRTVLQHQDMAAKFMRQLEQLLPHAEQDNFQFLRQRIAAAAEYFLQPLDQLIASIRDHAEDVRIKQRVKKYIRELNELSLLPERKKQELQLAIHIAAGLSQGLSAGQLLQEVEDMQKSFRVKTEEQEVKEEKKSGKATKGDSNRITLKLFREGKTIPEIAALRNLANGTIETHLISFIATGEVGITQLVEADKVKRILEEMAVQLDGPRSATAIKERLGDSYSFNDIRAVGQHKEWLNSQKEAQQ
ncbi:AAA family ATPase [Pseudoflavitalea sp. G-6-1-2]|uniref:helix-turn-helix domain-containing protein n=1 Tax=Pseudoflavitalea sp. G-6-1-2 TaxID=2728841 RepID=UPI001469EA9E|nr:helix-turn-helix domain-containing protein [Pseudoflavitalea sp. G-6-1-2]NML19924.1 AAA family ATPase [Pseudoflavitalea sp. G-6-1-2]